MGMMEGNVYEREKWNSRRKKQWKKTWPFPGKKIGKCIGRRQFISEECKDDYSWRVKVEGERKAIRVLALSLSGTKRTVGQSTRLNHDV